MTAKAPAPELALHLQSWLSAWPSEARGLWHDLARGRLPAPPTGITLKPHIRRAHWHLFWAGKGRGEPRVKWLPPIPVNVTRSAEPTVTVHPVGAGKEWG
jgi:hypothetical protein